MKHDWIRFRLVLPHVFGFLAAVLMTWDYENNRMVGSMGMGWDMGPPFWPYQAIYLLLFTINAPAFVSVYANPQAAKPSNAFPAIRRLVSGDRGLVVVDMGEMILTCSHVIMTMDRRRCK